MCSCVARADPLDLDCVALFHVDQVIQGDLIQALYDVHSWGPFTNDVCTEGGGGRGLPKKHIYKGRVCELYTYIIKLHFFGDFE